MPRPQPVWPAIDPGRMVHKIWILDKVESQDASGTVVSYQPIAGPIWAEIEPYTGREQLAAGQTTTQTLVTVKIYWQAGIANRMRVQTDTGSQYYIQSIDNPGERNILLLLNCMGLNENQ